MAGALLQDPVGSLATKNPPNFASLLNTMYALGGGVDGQTAASRWFDVARHYSATGRLKGLEDALAETALKRFLPEGTWPLNA
ncbi:hypothetical protein, partial [Paraburkholderia sp. SIMBA_053]|uniref:hypothetical protein n=1 Tax=Paraburkholderia sp. SIMBA_053 TaxID=3085794 RepID=UPI00397B86B9